MQVGYLEIVTSEVDAVSAAYAASHGVTFSEPIAALGGAVVASLAGGGQLGIRAPLRADEEPVVRPYMLVEDIEEALLEAQRAGGQVAVPAMPLPGQGTCAIYLLGGVEHGLWHSE